MPYNIEYLRDLVLNPQEFNNPLTNKQKKLIAKRFRDLSLIYHPDKHPENISNEEREQLTDHFHKIKKACEELLSSTQSNEPDELQPNEFWQPRRIDIPLSAFSFTLQTSILEAYEALISQFDRLASENEKKAFVTQYGSFLDLAYALEQNEKKINRYRQNALYERINKESLLTGLRREWRELILRLFAEEYLDDFKYRHALATGDFSNILAMRKLCSPIKCAALLLMSAILVISSSAEYFSKKLVIAFFDEVSLEYNKGGWAHRDIKKCVLIALKVIGLAVFLSAIPFLPVVGNLFYLAFSLPFIQRVLHVLASPINELIRPLAAYSSISSFALIPTLAIAAAAGVYSVIRAVIFGGGLSAVLPPLIIAISLYTVYSTFNLLSFLYKRSPAMAVCFALFFVLSVLLSELIPVMGVPFFEPDILIQFIAVLASATAGYFANQQIKKEDLVETLHEQLPLPNDTIPEHIQTTTTSVVKIASLSHRLFNTPKEAELIKPEARTPWQQLSSFFGRGMMGNPKPAPAASPHNTGSLSLVTPL